MKEALPQKMFYYFDESGDPKILGHRGKNLLQEGLVSKTFSVGYVEMSNPHQLLVDLEKLRKELMEDEYLKAVPSVKNLKNGFHANVKFRQKWGKKTPAKFAYSCSNRRICRCYK